MKTHFVLVFSTSPLSGCTTIYPSTHWRASWLLSSLGNYLAAINIHVQVFVWTYFSFPLSKYSGMWFLDLMVRVFQFCKETPNGLLKSEIHFAFPPAMRRRSYCYISPKHSVLSVFWMLAYHGDIAGSVLDHYNKASHNHL